MNFTDSELLRKEQSKFVTIDYDTLKTHNFVTDSLFRNPETVQFMMMTAACAFRTPFYHPSFPFQNEDEENEIAKLIPQMKKGIVIKNSIKTDPDFIHAYGTLLYKFMCFTLNYNNVYMYPQDFGTQASNIFRIKDTSCAYTEHQKNKPWSIVFHGTTHPRLYSIIRNGPKTLQVAQNGRSYGNGFYVTDRFELSQNYSDGFILVYKLYDPNTYKKMNTIYVVDDVHDLEFLYIIPKYTNRSIVETIRYGKTLELPQMASEVHSKRLLMDIKKSMAYFHEHVDSGISIKVNESDFHRWTVHLSRFPTDTRLFQDMKQINVKEIVLSFAFPQDYPFSPPFVRVVSPRFERWTGHVTYGGSLCTEFLTLNDTAYSWKPILSIPTVITMIKELLSLDGRLEKQQQGGSYNEKEAREAFQVALKKHGWKTT